MVQISPEPPAKDRNQDENEVGPSSILDLAAVHTIDSIEVSPLIRRLCWVVVVLLHSLVALYFYGYAEVYRYLVHHDDAMGPIDSLHDAVRRFDLSVRATSYAIAISHGLAVVYVVLCSVVARGFMFSLPPRKGRRLQLRERRSVFTSAVLISFKQLPHPRWWLANRFIASLQVFMERFVAAFQDSMKKSEMDMLQVTNAIEVGLQVFQANKLSNFIAKVWINRMMALVVVANCWCLPTIHFWYRHKSPRSEKLVKHAVDAVVDTTYGILIPFAIFYPYYRNVDLRYGYFSFQFYYMDTWRINFLAEANQVLVTSVVDFVSKMTPGVMLFHALWSIQKLVTEGSHHHKEPMTAVIQIDGEGPGTITMPSRKSGPNTQHPTNPLTAITKKKRKRCLDFALWCAGLLILTLHIHTTIVAYRGQDRGCLLEFRPWASRKYICVVLEVSCSQRHIAGRKAEIEAPLANVEPWSLQKLILSHCPDLEIPERFQTLSALRTLKIHNSSVAEWGQDAAITTTAHPELQWLIITLSNMSVVPQGMLSKDCPLVEINICGTNLTQLPESVAEEWTSVLKFGLELSPGITEIPRSIQALSPDMMSLSMNGITSIADDMFASQPYYILDLPYNPLSDVPASVMTLPQLQVLDIRGTLVSDLPVELLDTGSQAVAVGGSASGSSSLKQPVFVVAAGTPLCEKLIQEAASEGWDLNAVPFGSIFVGCIDDNSGPLSYPLSDEIKWRAANRV